MTEALTSQEAIERYLHWGCALLFADVTILPNNRVALTREQDALGLIQRMVNGYLPPRSTTGLYLGYIEDGTELDPGIGMQGDKISGLPAETNHLITDEKQVVRCGLQLSGLYEARKMVAYPPGFSTGTGFKCGGLNKPVPHNLFAVITNHLDPRFCLCRLYFQGVFQPGVWKVGYNRQAIPMTFLAEHAYKLNSTCLRAPGEGVMEEWYVETFSLQETIFVAPGVPPLVMTSRPSQSDFGINSLGSNIGWGW